LRREGRGKAAPERKRRKALKSKDGWGMGEIDLGAAKHGKLAIIEKPRGKPLPTSLNGVFS